MSLCTAHRCDAELPDGIHLCDDDTGFLEYRLAEVEAVWEDLQTTIARLDVQPTNATSGAAGSREPVNLDALDKAQRFRLFLRMWANELPGLSPIGEPPQVAAWLIGQVPEMRKNTAVGLWLRALTKSLDKLRAATDRAEQRTYSGDCPNDDTPVYTRTGSPTARCRTCGHEWDLNEWRGRALDYAADVPLTPVQLSRILQDERTGMNIPANTIYSWINRGKLKPIATGPNGEALYQLRKVTNLWGRARNRTKQKAAA